VETPDEVARWIKGTRVATHAAAASVWDSRVLVGGDVETFFDLASLTKPVLALAIRRSGLDVQTKLGTLVPESAGTATAEATLEDLLSHRAGLQAHIFLEPTNALEAAAAARKANREPLYSDLGYILAGVALARFSKTADAGLAMRRWVLEPLGLADRIGTLRDLDRDESLEDAAAPTEVRPGSSEKVRVHDENAWALTGRGGSGHAGLFGTIGGVADLVKHFIAERDRLGWMTIERPGGTLRAGFDGKSIEGSSAGSVLGPRSFGHLGFTGTSFWIDPDAAIGVVLLTNRVYPTRNNDSIRTARPTAHDALARIALARK
jgi:CubicO group peptidase (beta-lactamase class C family)